MESRDGTMGFDFEGIFTLVDKNERIEFSLEDNRKVRIQFSETDPGARAVQTFDADE